MLARWCQRYAMHDLSIFVGHFRNRRVVLSVNRRSAIRSDFTMFYLQIEFLDLSRCAHHRLVPSIFPTEKIPISRRYDNLASASFPPSDLGAMLLSSFLEKYFSPRLCYAKRINFAWPPLRLNRASLNRFTVY